MAIFSRNTQPGWETTIPPGTWDKTNLPTDKSGKIRIHTFDVDIPDPYPAGEDGTEFVIAQLPATPGRLFLQYSHILGFTAAGTAFDMGAIDIGWREHRGIKLNTNYLANPTAFCEDATVNAQGAISLLDLSLRDTTIPRQTLPVKVSPVSGQEYDTKVPLFVTLTTLNPVPAGGFIRGVLFYVTAQ